MVEFSNDPPVMHDGSTTCLTELFCIHFELMLGLAVCRPSRAKVSSAAKVRFNG